jgi:hypothetical protein
MLRLARVLLASLVVVLAPAAARAQDTPAGEAPKAPGDQPKPVGEYSGVPDAEAGAGSKVGHVRRGRYPQVLWLGFRARDEGGARLFVQLDRDVASSQAVVGGKLVISLPGARAASRNSLRWMDTRFFDSGVARIEARRAGRKRGQKAGIEIVVTFKDKVAPAEGSIASAQGKDGLTYLSLDFPPAPAG